MQYHTSEWLMNGIIETYTAQELAGGFDTIITSKINTGSVLNANIYVDSTVTPMLNSINGPMSSLQATVSTGSQSKFMGQYETLNGWSHGFYFNKLFIGSTGSENPWATVPWIYQNSAGTSGP